MRIYHIAYEADWARATQDGEYRISTRGRTLDEQGFIHAGSAAQVAPVANLIYGADDGLIILVIDAELLQSEVRYENVAGWDEPFPHIFGPINVESVIETLPLSRDNKGEYVFSV